MHSPWGNHVQIRFAVRLRGRDAAGLGQRAGMLKGELMKRKIGLVGLVCVGLFILAQAGSLEPPGPPAPTMKTLDEVAWAARPDVCFDNAGRFVVCGNGAVKDNAPGLFWLKRNVRLGRIEPGRRA